MANIFRKFKFLTASKRMLWSCSEDQIIEQVQAAYRSMLDREAEIEGQTHWITFMREGGTYDKLLLSFVRSAEFQRRLDESVLPDDPTTENNQIRAAYLCLLGREAEPEGFAHWANFLRNNGSYDRLLQSFIRSAEFQRRLDACTLPATASIIDQQAAATSALTPQLSPGKIAVLGNCQAEQMAHCIQALTDGEMPTWRCLTNEQLLSTESARTDLIDLFRRHDKVFMQPLLWNTVKKFYPELRGHVVLFPSISCLAFHPDLVTLQLKSTGASVRGPCENNHSCIAFLGWKAGLNVTETQKLYKSEIFQRLGYFHYWQNFVTALLEEGKTTGLALDRFLDVWIERGCFMHSIHHPKLFVIADIAKALLERDGIMVIPGDPWQYAPDSLASNVAWPVYPEIGEKFGISGNYTFKLAAPDLLPNQPVHTLDLEEFLKQSFATYSSHAADDLVCDRIDYDGYHELLADLCSLASEPAVTERATSAEPSLIVRQNAPKTMVDTSRFAVLGNCQTGHMARCLQALVGGKMPKQEWVTAEMLANWETGRASLAPLFAKHDKLFMQPWIWNPLAARYAEFKDQ